MVFNCKRKSTEQNWIFCSKPVYKMVQILGKFQNNGVFTKFQYIYKTKLLIKGSNPFVRKMFLDYTSNQFLCTQCETVSLPRTVATTVQNKIPYLVPLPEHLLYVKHYIDVILAVEGARFSAHGTLITTNHSSLTDDSIQTCMLLWSKLR